MAVSSETLFHFTPTMANLKGILSNKFRVAYCFEQYTLDYQSHSAYYPMISFCDIPLSLASNHIAKYGSFAIGLTKEWGIRNRLNPIVYLEAGSYLSHEIQSTLDNLVKITKHVQKEFSQIAIDMSELKDNVLASNQRIKELINVPSDLDKWAKSLVEVLKKQTEAINRIGPIYKFIQSIADTQTNLFRYIKNYQGFLYREGSNSKKYKFYDEREWRYVPEINNDEVKKSLTKDEFKNYRGTMKKKPFISDISLSFKANDIKYLVVKSTSDIPKLLKHLRNVDGLLKNASEFEIISTKIFTIEDINRDF